MDLKSIFVLEGWVHRPLLVIHTTAAICTRSRPENPDLSGRKANALLRLLVIGLDCHEWGRTNSVQLSRILA